MKMSLQDQIKSDMVQAMKNKETEKVTLLRVVSGEFQRMGKELTDDEAIKVIRKMSENAKELGNDSEIKILDVYLPQMYTDDQIRTLVSEIIIKKVYSGMGDMGNVMKEIKTHPNASQIDGKIASGIVRELLS